VTANPDFKVTAIFDVVNVSLSLTVQDRHIFRPTTYN